MGSAGWTRLSCRPGWWGLSRKVRYAERACCRTASGSDARSSRTAVWSWTSKALGIEVLGFAASVFRQSLARELFELRRRGLKELGPAGLGMELGEKPLGQGVLLLAELHSDRKSTRLNSSHGYISYAV